jgi:transposase
MECGVTDAWRKRDRVKLRRWCIRRLLEDWSIREVASHVRMPKSTVYDWWCRFQWKGWEGLVDVSRRPHHINHLPQETIAKVVEVRQREGWCAEAIEAYLKTQGVQVSHGSIYTILKQNGLIMKPYKPRKQRTFIRFAREHPDSLWQTDIKYYGDRYVIAYIDDCSRYVPALGLFEEATTDNVLHVLDEALDNGRVPNQMLTDHGTQHWSNDGDSRFTSFCIKHEIEHILGSTAPSCSV